MTNTEIIISKFRDAIDIEKEYTKIELIKILNDIYKNVKNKKKSVVSEKKPPTKYNLYVKDNIPNLKKKFPNLSRQDLMRKVSEKWKLHKEKSEVTDTDNNTNTDNNKKAEVTDNNTDTDTNTNTDTNTDIDNDNTKKSEVIEVTTASLSNTLENETNNKETVDKKENKKGKKGKK